MPDSIPILVAIRKTFAERSQSSSTTAIFFLTTQHSALALLSHVRNKNKVVQLSSDIIRSLTIRILPAGAPRFRKMSLLGTFPLERAHKTDVFNIFADSNYTPPMIPW